MALFFSFCLPSRKAGGLQIPCCQGIAVADYSFTLDALALKPSSFCNVGVNFVASSNEGAVRLWGKPGFETVGCVPKAFNHPTLGYVDAIVMYKWL